MSDAKGKKKDWNDYRVEQVVGRLLQIGVLLAAAVTVIGGAVYLARHGGEHRQLGVFVPEPERLRSVFGAVASAAQLRGQGLIQLGLLLLIATPIARVAFSVVAFALERDRLYVAVTLIVLAILLYSLILGG